MDEFSPKNDSQLIREFKQGNNKAFEALLLRHKKKIFYNILVFVKNRHDAEDIFQETFLKIIKGIKENTYKDEGKFIVWACTLAHNLCCDRKRKYDPTFYVPSDDSDIYEELGFSNLPADHELIKTQKQLMLGKMLYALPVEQRQVIVLRFYGDMSFREISNITNIKLNTTLGRMRYGLLNLYNMTKEKHITL